MTVNIWNLEQIIASKQNRQQKKGFPHRDTDIGNGMQPSMNLNILDKRIYLVYEISCIRFRLYITNALNTIHSVCFSSV